MQVSAEAVKTLRERTSAGVIECKKALEETSGNVDAAEDLLRKKGIAKGHALAEKKSSQGFTQGLVEAYIHGGGRIGAMVEINCETDFVARTDDFKRLAREIAMQVAAMAPLYVGSDDLPPKPEGKLEEISLLHQPYIRDASKTVKDLLAETIGKVGENIRVRRFSRFELGG